MTNQQWLDLSNFLDGLRIIHRQELYGYIPHLAVYRDSVARLPQARKLDPEQANELLLSILNKNLVPLGFPRFHYAGKTDDVLYLVPVEGTKS